MNNKFMQRALDLAARGSGRTSPNPMVGAVIVKGDTIIAEGYHRKAGTAHAEAVALKKAGIRARGATLYINLEPCCHTEKRTPPCTKAIIAAGIHKVVAAMIDPNPRVAGKGLRELRVAGIITESGVMKPEALKLNESFNKYIRTKKPFVILKVAQSLDGKTATARGESKWITGPQARKLVHRMRNSVDAVLAGISTVLIDNPSLDCRISGGRNPFRVIVDSRLRIPLSAKVLSHGDGRTIVATTGKAGRRRTALLERRGITVLTVREKKGRVDLKSLMRELGRSGITSIMIEGGSSLSASALSEKIVDKVMFFIAPRIIGGVNALPSIGGKSPALLRNAFALKNLSAIQIGRDFLLEGYIEV